MTISAYSTTAASNTSINSLSVAEGCPPGNLNNAVRELMADIASDAMRLTGNQTITGTKTLNGTTVIATADVNGGTIDGTAIGGTVASAGSFTTLAASGAVTLGDASGDTVTHNAGTLSIPNNLAVTGGNFFVGTTSAQTIGGVLVAPMSVQNATASRWVSGFSNTTSGTALGVAVYYTAVAPNNAVEYFYYAVDSSAIRFTVNSNGGISNYSANNVNLSDEREKRDIRTFDAAADLDAFLSYEVVDYKYNDQTHDDDNLGVIAQRLRASHQRNERYVDPDSWQTLDGESRMSVYDGDMHYRTMAQAQHAHRLIAAMADRIAALEAKLTP